MNLLKRFSLMPAILSFAAMIILLFLDLDVHFIPEPESMLSILDALFTGILPISAVIMTIRIYLKTDLPSALLMSCGLLVFGIGSSAAGFMRFLPDGLNARASMENISTLIASIFLLMGTMLGTKKGKLYKYREFNVIITIIGITTLMVGLILIIYYRVIPPFYAQIGPTLTRLIILGTAITFFFTSATLMSKLYLMQRKNYFLWYAAALFMLTMGIIAMEIQPDPGSIIDWIGRADRYLGGIYFVICITSLWRETERRDANYEISNDFFIEAEQVYRNLAESSSDAILSVDENFRIFFSNSAATMLFGLTKDNIRETSFLDMLCSEADREKIKRDVLDFTRSNTHDLRGETLEMEARSWEGRNFPIELSVTIRRLDSGIASTYIIRDITFRKLAQQKAVELAGSLQKQLEFEQMVMKLAQDFINTPVEKMDLSIRDALRMIAGYVHGERASIYHYDWESERVAGSIVWELNPSSHTFTTGEELDVRDVESAVACFKENEHMELMDFNNLPDSNRLKTHVRKSEFKSLIIYKLFDADKVIGAFSVSTYTAEKAWSDSEKTMLMLFAELLSNALSRKIGMEALHESNERNKLLLNSTNDGIMMLDREGNILNINAQFAERYGKGPEDIISRNWNEFMQNKAYEDVYRRRRERFTEVFETGQTQVFEDSRDGLTFYNRFYPVCKDGAVAAVTLFSTDITDRVRAQEETRKTSEYLSRLRVQTEFFTNISHELKTPLSIILIQLELLKLYRLDEKKVNAYIAAATQNAYRLTRLVVNLLDITKLDAGYMKANLAHMDIVPVIAEITESVNDYALEKDIRLHFETKSIGYFMAGDRDKLERILLNLLSNAVKHTRRGGSINVSLKGKPASVLIGVADTGEGIPKEKQCIIFDRFAQVDTSLTRKTEGSGIGLALAKSLVELLKGRIWVESEEGKGSTFFVELPVQEIDEKMRVMQIEGYDLNRRVEMEFSDIFTDVSEHEDIPKV